MSEEQNTAGEVHTLEALEISKPILKNRYAYLIWRALHDSQIGRSAKEDALYDTLTAHFQAQASTLGFIGGEFVAKNVE